MDISFFGPLPIELISYIEEFANCPQNTRLISKLFEKAHQDLFFQQLYHLEKIFPIDVQQAHKKAFLKLESDPKPSQVFSELFQDVKKYQIKTADFNPEQLLCEIKKSETEVFCKFARALYNGGVAIPRDLFESDTRMQFERIRQWMYDNQELLTDYGNLTLDYRLFLFAKDIIPREIKYFSGLTKLTICCNELIDLPPEFFELVELRELSLKDCQLKSLPEEIGNLTNLWLLNLEYNQLKSLPSGLTKLKDLSFVDLSRNMLKSIPIELMNLKLEYLCIDENVYWNMRNAGHKFVNIKIFSVHFGSQREPRFPYSPSSLFF